MQKYVVTLLQGTRKIRRIVQAVDQADADQQGENLADAEGLAFKRAEPDINIGDTEPTTRGGILDF
jgi:hypothetical protein